MSIVWDEIEDHLLLDEGESTDVVKNKPFKDYTQTGYLCVTDIVSQCWCEQKVLYQRTVPVVVEETPRMAAGSDIHLARELEVHDIVKVNIVTKEDKWGVKLLNLLQSINSLLCGATVAREVPVFSEPYDANILVHGIIDEIRLDTNDYGLDIYELKTRQKMALPSAWQKTQHALQMRLYKCLLDDMICGNVSQENFKQKLNLDFSTTFSDDLAQKFDIVHDGINNLTKLWETVMSKIQCLTKVQNLYIEYVHQETKETIQYVATDYNDSNLESEFLEYLKFWTGMRPVKGVDIEEAWKCSDCEFSDICTWRKTKNNECIAKNAKNKQNCLVK